MFRLWAGAAALAERASPSSRQDVHLSRAQQRPAGTVPSQGHPCQRPRNPGILYLLPESCSPHRAHCRGEPGFAARGTGGVEQRRAGHQEVGAENPRRESRRRSGSGGRWRSGELQYREGGPRHGPPTG